MLFPVTTATNCRPDTGEAAASLPAMAGDAAEQDRAIHNATLSRRLGASLNRITVLTIPTTFAFLLLGRDIVRVLYQSGSFDEAATESASSRPSRPTASRCSGTPRGAC